jgi:hypothetical protein
LKAKLWDKLLKAKIAERSALFLAHFRPGVDMVRVAVLHRHTLEHIEMNLRQFIEIRRDEKIQKIFFGSSLLKIRIIGIIFPEWTNWSRALRGFKGLDWRKQRIK